MRRSRRPLPVSSAWLAAGFALAGPGAHSECVQRAQIDHMSQGFTCVGLHRLLSTRTFLPHDCHLQGIAWNAALNRFVVTCQDLGSGTRGRILAYSRGANFNREWLALSTASGSGPDGAKHPSATQFFGPHFPVAFAPTSNRGPSRIQFFRLGGDSRLTAHGSAFDVGGHVGAMAYARVAGRLWLVGCGYDCDTLTILRGRGTDPSEGFDVVKSAATSRLVDPSGVDGNVGPYNSIQLTTRCDDGRPLLFASHHDWLDVWEVNGLGTARLRLKKIRKRRITEDVVRWGSRPIFYEGMALRHSGDRLLILAAPHDFGTNSCPTDTRCAQYAYECRFGSGS